MTTHHCPDLALLVEADVPPGLGVVQPRDHLRRERPRLLVVTRLLHERGCNDQRKVANLDSLL